MATRLPADAAALSPERVSPVMGGVGMSAWAKNVRASAPVRTAAGKKMRLAGRGSETYSTKDSFVLHASLWWLGGPSTGGREARARENGDYCTTREMEMRGCIDYLIT